MVSEASKPTELDLIYDRYHYLRSYSEGMELSAEIKPLDMETLHIQPKRWLEGPDIVKEDQLIYFTKGGFRNLIVLKYLHATLVLLIGGLQLALGECLLTKWQQTSGEDYKGSFVVYAVKKYLGVTIPVFLVTILHTTIAIVTFVGAIWGWENLIW